MIFNKKKLSSAALGLLLSTRGADSVLYRGTVTVMNMAPSLGTSLTPVWVGIHDGTFDTYDRGAATSAPLERLAEDGNNAPLIADFEAADGGVWDGVVGSAPIQPGETVQLEFEIDVTAGTALYFSYASMVLPSNDAFVANGNPMANLVFTDGAMFSPVTINSLGSQVLDAGTEVNTELPLDTAFFGQNVSDTGMVEGEVVTLHPGFNAAGGILDDPMFANANFTEAGYEMMQITVQAAVVPVVTRSGFITIENTAPDLGTCLTPVWVGIHDGTFDTYDRGAPTSAPLERLAEDGNNAPLIALFADPVLSPGGVWDGTVGGMPICPGDTATIPFELDVELGVAHYFSYASMILPSNDAFVANGNPKAHLVFDANGMLTPLSFGVMGSEVLDAGTEVNTELPLDTAFFGQNVSDTGMVEGGNVTLHPGFNPVASGGILADPTFANADFTADDYQAMMVSVTLDEPTAAPAPQPTAAPTPAPSKKRCFSERATVQVEGQAKPVEMKDLVIGDRVLANKHGVYEPIYAFGHLHTTQPADFLKISTDSTSSALELSEEHMLFVHGKNGPVRADSLKVGDVLVRVNNEERSTANAVVTRITTVKRKGLYAPLTRDGTIVVDGILASTYAGVQSQGANEYVEIGEDHYTIPLLQADMIHWYLSPLRVLCTGVSPKLFCGEHDDNGVHTYVAFGMKLLKWGERQHAGVQVCSLALVLLVTGAFAAIEMLASSFGLLVLAAVVAWKVAQKQNDLAATALKKVEA